MITSSLLAAGPSSPGQVRAKAGEEIGMFKKARDNKAIPEREFYEDLKSILAKLSCDDVCDLTQAIDEIIAKEGHGALVDVLWRYAHDNWPDRVDDDVIEESA